MANTSDSQKILYAKQFTELFTLAMTNKVKKLKTLNQSQNFRSKAIRSNFT